MAHEGDDVSERGWARSRDTRTLVHYFVDGQSLCGRWVVTSALDLMPEPRATAGAVSADDCVACTKKLSAEAEPSPVARLGDRVSGDLFNRARLPGQILMPSNVLSIFGKGETVYVEGWFCDGTGELRKDLAVDATNRYIEFIIGDYASGGIGLSVGQGDNGWCVCVELLSVDPRVAIPWPVRISERHGSPIAFVECPDTTRVTWIQLERLLEGTGGVG